MKVSILLATLSVLGVASSAEPASQCTGTLQCCQRLGLPSDQSVALLLGLVGLPISESNSPVGLTCTSRYSSLHLLN
ncbi:hypothetical protein BDV40DRAFT_97994 [Aspergillus tamarii]|uniref:Uncharacterized protein n=1 Tax=Aspergillus tamarii TaxID=41984 RepID=A0A5N6VBJ7_ASPTM|nr:hypothetical protein BDV40DRAFT_97994 [Aspergillus tamarii]